MAKKYELRSKVPGSFCTVKNTFEKINKLEIKHWDVARPSAAVLLDVYVQLAPVFRGDDFNYLLHLGVEKYEKIQPYFDGLVWEYIISSALAMEIRQSCTKPSIHIFPPVQGPRINGIAPAAPIHGPGLPLSPCASILPSALQ